MLGSAAGIYRLEDGLLRDLEVTTNTAGEVAAVSARAPKHRWPMRTHGARSMTSSRLAAPVNVTSGMESRLRIGAAPAKAASLPRRLSYRESPMS
jgi:hypothetical protein